ncbi:hypothetical protein E2562_022962 [Oryza meyeriana var. granulata]|uniref:Uncharacterized protein n=1 Tax=Oryza meyeriana var. granulata TaxID=110450 RepID=A0A6G1D777_9ORYZ|nr:hypothetical protein E2562_022962 [Oryza meyeriana var. granulata]
MEATTRHAAPTSGRPDAVGWTSSGARRIKKAWCFLVADKARRKMELPLRCFHSAKVAAGDGQDGRAAVPAGKVIGWPAKGGAGVARGVRVVVRGLVDKAGKAFGQSIPAARFGHLAYIR